MDEQIEDACSEIDLVIEGESAFDLTADGCSEIDLDIELICQLDIEVDDHE